MKAFDIITGSSIGGYSDRAMCYEIANLLTGTEKLDCLDDLARMTDDEISEHGLVEDFTSILELQNMDALLADYCHLEWRDNELTVMPSVESAIESCPTGDELPDSVFDTFVVINERGNVSLYRANGSEWREVWAVV